MMLYTSTCHDQLYQVQIHTILGVGFEVPGTMFVAASNEVEYAKKDRNITRTERLETHLEPHSCLEDKLLVNRVKEDKLLVNRVNIFQVYLVCF